MPTPTHRAIGIETPSTVDNMVLNPMKASTPNANEAQHEGIDIGHRVSDAAEGMFCLTFYTVGNSNYRCTCIAHQGKAPKSPRKSDDLDDAQSETELQMFGPENGK
jgi:hypothetical protein